VPSWAILHERTAQILQEEIDLWLHVAERPIGTEFSMVLGLEILVEHFPKKRAGLPELIFLILHGNPDSAVVLEDLSPRMFGVAALPTQRPISKGHSP
jgi:hypothetical protein